MILAVVASLLPAIGFSAVAAACHEARPRCRARRSSSPADSARWGASSPRSPLRAARPSPCSITPRVRRRDWPNASAPNALLIGGIDLSSPDVATKAMDNVKAKFGRLDALLNIAGGFQWETVEDGKDDSWDRMYALNLKTALNACEGRAALSSSRAAPAASSMSARNPPCTRRPDLAPTRPASRRCTG